MLLSAERGRERKARVGVERGGTTVRRNVNGKVDVRARSNLFIKVSRLPSVSSVDEDEMWLTAKIVLLQRVRRSFFIVEIDYECTQGVRLIVDSFLSFRFVSKISDIYELTKGR